MDCWRGFNCYCTFICIGGVLTQVDIHISRWVQNIPGAKMCGIRKHRKKLMRLLLRCLPAVLGRCWDGLAVHRWCRLCQECWDAAEVGWRYTDMVQVMPGMLRRWWGGLAIYRWWSLKLNHKVFHRYTVKWIINIKIYVGWLHCAGAVRNELYCNFPTWSVKCFIAKIVRDVVIHQQLFSTGTSISSSSALIIFRYN